MPDKWGRPTAEDGLNMGLKAMGLSSQMKKSQIYDAELENIERDKQNREQVGLGLAALRKGGERPEGISEQNWITAKGQYASGLGHDANISKFKHQDQVREAANRFVPVLNENGMNFNAIKPTNSAEVSALAGLVDKYSQTEEGKATILKNRKNILKSKYSDFVAGRNQVKTLLSEGKTDQAIKGIELMSSNAPLPYSLSDYDPKTKTFGIKYLDSAKGNTPTGERMPLNDVWQMISGMDEKQFFMQGAQHAAAIRQNNLENQKDPSKHIYATGQKDGKTYTIVPQKDLSDLSEVDYLVFSESGGDPIKLKSMAEVKKHFKIENLDREKSLADIEGSKALTRQRESAIGLNAAKLKKAKSDAARDARKDVLKHKRDALSDMASALKGVKDGSGNTINLWDSATLESMPESERIPFIQKVVDVSNDSNLSRETRSIAKQYLRLAQDLGYVSAPPSQAEVELKQAYQRLIREGRSPQQARELILKANPDKAEMLTGRKARANKPH